MNPIENALNEYIGKDLSRFHMPGHKGGENFPEYFKFDITEVKGADSLFESSEAIFETEKIFQLKQKDFFSEINAKYPEKQLK